jgi:hypothetical protein
MIAPIPAVVEPLGSSGLQLIALVKTETTLLGISLVLAFVALVGVWLRRRFPLPWLLLFASLFLLLGAQLQMAAGAFDPSTGPLGKLVYLQLCFFSGIACYLLRGAEPAANERGAAAVDESGARKTSGSRQSRSFLQRPWLGSLSLLIMAALPIRFWELSRYPKFFGEEHAYLGWGALRVLEGQFPLTLVSLFHFTTGHYASLVFPFLLYPQDLIAAALLLFGYTVEAMRLVPTLLGVLAVLLTWHTGRRWFSEQVGFCSAFLMAVSPFMIGLSRDLHAGIVGLVVFALLVLHFLLRSLTTPSLAAFLVTASLGFYSLHLYKPAYVTLPLVFGFWGYLLLRDRQWRAKSWRRLCLALPPAALVAVPILYYQFSERFSGRFQHFIVGYSVLQPGTEPTARILDNLTRVWKHIAYDGSPLFFTNGVESYLLSGIWGTVFLPLVSACFFVGLGCCIARLRDARAFSAVLAVALLGLLPAIFSQTIPRRIVMFLPAFFLVAGQGGTFVFDGMKAAFGRTGRWLTLLLTVLSAAVFLSVGWGVFMEMARTAKADPSRELSEAVASAIKQDEMVVLLTGMNPSLRYSVYVLAGDELRMHETTRLFLFAKTAEELEALQPAPDTTHVRFAVGLGGKQETTCSLADLERSFPEVAAQHPDWESQRIGGSDRRVAQEYHLVRAPIGDFEEARRLARRCF